MHMLDLIDKKKKGKRLSKEEIYYIVQGYTEGVIPDYQISALLMAIYFQGMDAEETRMLTMAMVESGDQIDLSGIEGIKVDKHSTGGVGDKVSLVVIPLVASLGIPVAKMSGRGLGHTGGTIDKLESIEGFDISLSMEKFMENVNTYKMAIVGQTGDLTPADKKLYALRDVTATVDSIPLIASSIMSKKIASGSDAIVLDVKVGNGAFMKTLEDARALAKAMVSIGRGLGRDTVAVLTNMNEPLGKEVGNANEVREAIKTLKGEGMQDLVNVSVTIAGHMAVLGGAFDSVEDAEKAIRENMKNGKALEMLKTLVKIQGGNVSQIENPDLLPAAKISVPVISKKKGFVHEIKAEEIGTSAMLLGAGRETKEDVIDYAAGITLQKKVGDEVNEGDVLCTLLTNRENYQDAYDKAQEAYDIADERPEHIPFILDVITEA
ncbi:pyrimidine-nucleoside phosphorylase [Proteiniclasticum ruminis]|jgi:pyrimidine-nucleoside phosphorylase/thymidine phosphorylase|uniref:Pyrimidine-nucleoside phosphorylase n=1 Tax=Proteiniclasticum ruminis TaxID=398199 RepID=A0A1G8MWH5_9CLOT|nr:pyrimidine-nucleoside phosphorylase [Proteiniclasticum ruminis]SDI72331.1 pyrimidine-nucleoside phosphorylase/thymidine phosphorylase [Proteiniclasticum ruminis]